MADEPRTYNPGWTDPREPGTDPVSVGEGQLGPSTDPGVPVTSLPPQIKGDDGIVVDYDGYAYIVRLHLGDAPVISDTEDTGLYTAVWRERDGRYFRVDFTSIYARLVAQDARIEEAVQAGFESNLETLTAQQDAFEAGESAARAAFEQATTSRQASYEQGLTARQNTYETTVTARQASFETTERDARTAFQVAQTARQQGYETQLTADWSFFRTNLEARQEGFETDELEARASFETGVNGALAAQDARILAVETAWTSYQGTVNARLAAHEAEIRDELDGMDLRITEAERISSEALATARQIVVPDRSLDFIKLSQAIEDMIRDKRWTSLTGVPASVTNIDALLDAKGNLTGGNTWTGSQTFKSTSGSLQNYVDRPAGSTAYWTFRTSGKNRWQFGVNSTAESGGNAGTKFLLKRFDDAGAEIDTPLEFDRATGAAKLTVRPSWAGFTPWDSGNFDPASKANAAHTHNITDVNDLLTWLNDRPTYAQGDARYWNTGDAINTPIDPEIQNGNPGIWFHAPGVRRARLHMGGDGTLHLQDQGGGYFWYINNVGNMYMPWAGQWLSDRINGRTDTSHSAYRYNCYELLYWPNSGAQMSSDGNIYRTWTGNWDSNVMARTNVSTTFSGNLTAANPLYAAYGAGDTTANAANTYMNSTSGRLYRSTSSGRFKTAIEPMWDEIADKLLAMRPIYYRSNDLTGDDPDKSWYGLLAEEVAALDPRLVSWGRAHKRDEKGERIRIPERLPVFNEDGTPQIDSAGLQVEEPNPRFEEIGPFELEDEETPQGVAYERLTVLLIQLLQRMHKDLRRKVNLFDPSRRFSKKKLFEAMTDAEYDTWEMIEKQQPKRKARMFSAAQDLAESDASWPELRGTMVKAYGETRTNALLDAAEI